jgi:hypothetical protein
VLCVRHWLLRKEGRVDVAVLWILFWPAPLLRRRFAVELGLCERLECWVDWLEEKVPWLLLLLLLAPMSLSFAWVEARDGRDLFLTGLESD